MRSERQSGTYGQGMPGSPEGSGGSSGRLNPPGYTRLHRSGYARAPGRSESSIRREASAISSTAVSNASRFAADGARYPLTFLTNWSAAARTSSSLAGPSALRRVWMLRHMATA
jgi:hypothetical protein